MISRALLCLAVLALVSSAAHALCPDTATYYLLNICDWTEDTHPTDFPEGTDAFGTICGTAHNADYQMFSAGGISTNGLRDNAELGDCLLLEGEIDACAAAGSCKPEGYFAYNCLNSAGDVSGVCNHVGTFEVSTAYPYVSATSMVFPSPDWFVGISSVDLCQPDENGEDSWVERYPPFSFETLNAYDAGTDGGESFQSEDLPLDPFIPISVFDAMDASNIFYNQEEGRLYPLCHLTLIRI